MPDVVVLASGGINSTVAAVRAAKSGAVYLLHADHGQVSAVGQRAAVRAVADALGAAVVNIELPHVPKLAAIRRSTTGKVQMEARAVAVTGGTSKDSGSVAGVVSQTPGLAAGLLSAGVQFASRVGASAVVSGASELANELETESAPGCGQPDHRREFWYLAGMMFAQLQRSRTPITIETPLIDLSRGDIIKLGHRDGAPFDLTYSCRAARDVPCGQCAACGARTKAFAVANLLDPALAAVRG